MYKLKQYCCKKKYILLFFAVLFVFGFVVGLYLGVSNIDLLKENVLYYQNNLLNQSYNYILIHFFFLTISFVLSFFTIGIPLLCAILFYEGMCLGFLNGIFSLVYGISGFFFSFFFFLITKFVFVILFVLFFLKCLEIARKMIGKYLYKTDPSIVITKLAKACFVLIVLALTYDIFIALFGRNLIGLFGFLLNSR